MGNEQSSEHSSHFRRPETTETRAPEASDEVPVQAAHLINISNKMVERLVEEHRMNKETNKPRNDRRQYQDKMYIEQLKCIDQSHSEQTGMMPEDLEALVGRVHVRAAKIVKLEPVCGDCEAEVVSCYSINKNKTECTDEISKFKKCVSEQTSLKLLTRILDMEDEQFRKSRDLENARKHNLWGNFQPQNTNA